MNHSEPRHRRLIILHYSFSSKLTFVTRNIQHESDVIGMLSPASVLHLLSKKNESISNNNIYSVKFLFYLRCNCDEELPDIYLVY